MNTRSVTCGLALVAAIAVSGATIAPTAFAAPAGERARNSAQTARTAEAAKASEATEAVKSGVQPSAARAKKPKGKPKDDFNGDGYQDLAVAAPHATVEKKKSAGYVSVLYGSKSGLRTTGKQVVHRGTPGTPGIPASNDEFGRSISSADFNQDGYADLAVNSWGRGLPVPGRKHLEVTVLWGSAKGLGRGKTAGFATDGYNEALVAGDFDGDRRQDIATAHSDGGLMVLHGPFKADGSPAGTSYTPEVDNEAARWVGELTAGDTNRDGITDIVGLHGWTGERPGTALMYHWKGTADGPADPRVLGNHVNEVVKGDSLDLGDVNKDGFDDIVVGQTDLDPYDDTDKAGGRITHLPGSAGGPVGVKSRIVDLNTAGVPGTPANTRGFGSGVAVGDADGDGYADIAVGASEKRVSGKIRAGGVITLRGTKSGPTGSGAREFTQDTKNVPGSAEKDDLFGSHARFLDGDGDGRTELAVTAIGENKGAGSVWVLPAGSGGITAAKSLVYGGKALGTAAAPGERFGERYTD
ncbi:FG-GAP-like repeat-containing protein [Streptomyces sp. NPDC014894]|uniref:FG-GAP-like repeat-containing protein n=1 Tax=unclassified Streptomyces TaxID=2593676 RepID=UPI003702FF01